MQLSGAKIALAALAILAAILVVAAVASGVGNKGRAPATTRATIYFLVDGGRASLGVRRTIRKLPPKQGATIGGALAALLAGPTAAERKRGLTTGIPAGTRLRLLSFRGRGGVEAIVDLSGLPPAHSATPFPVVRVLTQVARTVIGLSGIERVRVLADGRPWNLLTMQGKISSQATDYRTLLGFYDICTSRPGTEATRGDCFTALP